MPPFSATGDDDIEGNIASSQKLKTSTKSDGSFSFFREIMKDFIEDRPLTIVQEAALLLEFASFGKDLEEYRLTSRTRLCHRFRVKYQMLYRLTAWAFLLLLVFQRPGWTYRSTAQDSWSDGAVYPSFRMPYMSLLSSALAHSACLAVLWFVFFLEHNYKRNTPDYLLTAALGVVLFFLTVSVSLCIVYATLSMTDADSLSGYASWMLFALNPLAASLPLLIEHRSHEDVLSFVRTLPKFFLLLTVLFAWLALYTVLGFEIFDPQSSEAREYFPDYGTALWNMLMVLCGSNWPAPILPAVRENRLFSFFFFVLVIAGDWALLNLVLGFVYFFFRAEHVDIAQRTRAIRKRHMHRAFRVLSSGECGGSDAGHTHTDDDLQQKRSKDNDENKRRFKRFVSQAQMDALLEELFTCYVGRPTLRPPTADERHELLLLLPSTDFSQQMRYTAEEISPDDSTLTESILTHVISRAPTAEHPHTVERVYTERDLQQLFSFCGPAALQRLRDQKRRFTRYVHVYTAQDTFTKDQQAHRSFSERLSSSLSFSLSCSHQNTHSRPSFSSHNHTAYRTHTIFPPPTLTKPLISFTPHPFHKYSDLPTQYLSAIESEEISNDLTESTSLLHYHTDMSTEGALGMSAVVADEEEVHKQWQRTISAASAYSNIDNAHLLDRLAQEVMRKHSIQRPYTTGRTISRAMSESALTLTQLLEEEGEEEPVSGFLQRCGRICACQWWWDTLCVTVDSKSFSLVSDICVSVLCVWCFAQSAYGDENKWSYPVTVSVWLCVALSLCEAALRLAVKGWFRCVSSARFAVDTTLAVGLLALALTHVALSQRTHTSPSSSHHLLQAVRLSVLVRALLCGPRSVWASERFRRVRMHNRVAFAHAFRSANHLVFLGLVMFCVLFGVSSLGVQIFGGVIRKTGEVGDYIRGSDYGTGGYWPLSFNDFLSSLMTLVTLLHVNNTHVIASGFVSVNASLSVCEGALCGRGARVFFALWYCTGVLLLLNVLVAVLVNQFAGYLEILQKTRKRQKLLKQREKEKKKGRNREIEQMEKNTVDGREEIEDKNGEWSSLKECTPTPITPASVTHTHDPLHRTTVAPSTAAGFEDSIFASASERESLSAFIQQQLAAQSPPRSILKRPAFAAKPTEAYPRNVNGEGAEKQARGVRGPRLVLRDDDVHDRAVDGVAADEDAHLVVSLAVHSFSDNLSHSQSLSHSQTDPHTTAQRDALSAAVQALSEGDPLPPGQDAMPKTHHMLTQQQTEASTNGPKFSFTKTSSDGDDAFTTIHEQAAVLVQLARDGEEVPQHSLFLLQSRRALRFYQLRTKASFLLKIVALAFVLLKFFERPLWTYGGASNLAPKEWSDGDVYPSAHMLVLSPRAAVALKFPLIFILFSGLLCEIGYEESFNSLEEFLQNWSFPRFLRFSLALLCFVYMVLLLIVVGSDFSLPHLVPFTSYGAIALFMWFNRRSLQRSKVVLRVVPRFSLSLAMLCVLVLLFAALGPEIFPLSPQHTHTQTETDTATTDDDYDYFSSLSQSYWSVFTLLTSSNFPNQVLPAYRAHRETALFTLSLLCVGAFGLLNLLIVLVLVSFHRAQQLMQDKLRAVRQILLAKAFAILDVKGEGILQKAEIHPLLDELYAHYSDFHSAGVSRSTARSLLLDILDSDGDGVVSLSDFLLLLDVLRIKISVHSKYALIEVLFPRLRGHPWVESLKSIVNQRVLDVVVDVCGAVLIAMNLFLHRDDLYTPTKTSILMTFAIFSLYVIEIICKLLVMGKAYFRSFRNSMDFSVTALILFCFLAQTIYFGNITRATGFTYVVRILLMVRLLVIPRNIRLVFEGQREITKFSRLLRRIFVKIFTLAIVFFCVGYSFASLGMTLFGGTIRYDSTDPDFNASRYAENQLYVLNFNDLASAFITLFACLHVSDFDAVTSGYSTLSHKSTARAFFALWYAVGVLLLLNIVKSFFLGEFLAVFVSPRKRRALKEMHPPTDHNDTLHNDSHPDLHTDTPTDTLMDTHADAFPETVDSHKYVDAHIRQRFAERLRATGGIAISRSHKHSHSRSHTRRHSRTHSTSSNSPSRRNSSTKETQQTAANVSESDGLSESESDVEDERERAKEALVSDSETDSENEYVRERSPSLKMSVLKRDSFLLPVRPSSSTTLSSLNDSSHLPSELVLNFPPNSSSPVDGVSRKRINSSYEEALSDRGSFTEGVALSPQERFFASTADVKYAGPEGKATLRRRLQQLSRMHT